MKAKHLILFVFFLSTLSLYAQRGIRIAYVDMEFILKSVPEYQQASQLLDEKVAEWKAEIDERFSEVSQQREALEKEKVFLTKELIREKEEEIAFLENEIVDYQQKRFGPNGDLEIQKRQLVQPVQDQVFNAVQEIASKRQYDFVFDKSADVVMLYSAKKYDISDLIVRIINRNAKIDAQGNEVTETIDDILEETDPATLSREELIEQRRLDRLKALEDRRAAIEKARADRQKQFDERRQLLLDQREARKTGKTVAQIRAERGDNVVDTTATKPSKADERRQNLDAKKQEAEALKAQRLKDLEERRQRLLDEREAKRSGKTIEQIRAEREGKVSQQKDTTVNIATEIKDKVATKTEATKGETPKDSTQVDTRSDRQKAIDARRKAAEEERQRRIKEFEERRKKLKEAKEKKNQEKENKKENNS
ncbi:MAG: OmpH family outer membrane protein [Flavobacteriaceae bacterium]|nr:OmpH family outer membrane protein [Flavobacteriaceae bacterium]